MLKVDRMNCRNGKVGRIPHFIHGIGPGGILGDVPLAEKKKGV